MQKKILITGSNGLLGQKLILALKNQHEVLATSISDCVISDTNGFVYQSLDITDRISVIKTFENFKPDVVINTAAMTDVDGCEEKKGLCDKVNVTAVGYLIDECEKYKAHLISNSKYLNKAISSNRFLSYKVTEGGMFAMVNISKLYENSDLFCTKLLKATNVAVTPGIVFSKHWDDHIRVSLAGDKLEFKEAIKRLLNFINTKYNKR